MRKFSLIFTAALFLLAGIRVQAALTRITVEQVRVVYPYVTVYYQETEDGEAESDFSVEAWLDDTPLTLLESEEETCGTVYYVLLDISGSIPSATFNAAKEQILELVRGLSEEDSLTLITFGDDVSVQFSGSDADTLEETLAGLSASDQTTHVYQAIQEAVTLSQTEGNGLSRQIMIVVSDGADISEDSVSYAEVMERLNETDIPLYAMCSSNASSSDRSDFGSFARSTGGSIYVFDATSAQSQWEALTDGLAGYRSFSFTAASGGKAPTGSHTFLLKLTDDDGSVQDYTQTVSVTSWVQDMTAPVVESAEYDQDVNTLTLIFSEEVSGADNVSNYTLTASDGSQIDVLRVEEAGIYGYCLYLSQVPSAGDAVLTVSNVTDVSMEENPLADTTVIVTCPEALEETVSDTETDIDPEIESAQNSSQSLIVILAVVGVVIVIAVIAAAVILSSGKEAETEEPVRQETVVRHVVEHVQGGSVSHLEPGSCSRVQVSFMDKNGAVRRSTIQINRSTILGRKADMCDICVEDPRVSGQHCAMEEGGDGIYVIDLNSRNGVWINDCRLALGSRRKIEVNDRLRIGDTIFVIEQIQLNGKGTA